MLQLAASLEQYSKHPLAGAIAGEAQKQETKLLGVTELSEAPGEGLRGTVERRTVRITGRKQAEELRAVLPAMSSGLECVVFINERYAATMRFHDAPRSDSRLFIQHLKPRHGVRKVMLVSGDRESEVQYLADSVGISEVWAGKSPEEKVAIVKQETAKAKTLFVGDGINDAPALTAATVGVAFGSQSGIITEAADAVILETSLGKIDELMHIGRRMRRIALQSALGGMIASIVGMIAAVLGYLPPIGGAIAQEIIDLFAVLNAVRVALPTDDLQDFRGACDESVVNEGYACPGWFLSYRWNLSRARTGLYCAASSGTRSDHGKPRKRVERNRQNEISPLPPRREHLAVLDTCRPGGRRQSVSVEDWWAVNPQVWVKAELDCCSAQWNPWRPAKHLLC